MPKPNVMPLISKMLCVLTRQGPPRRVQTKDGRYIWPTCRADAIRNGYFSFDVIPEPRKFIWDETELEIFECWYEESQSQLYFRINLDEHSHVWPFCICDRERKQIWFKRTDMPFLRSSVGFSYGKYWNIGMFKPDQTKVQICAGTKKVGHEPEMTDTIISFDWTQQSVARRSEQKK